MTTPHAGENVAQPSCWDDCAATLRDDMASMGIEATVSTAPPIIATPYDQRPFICPHKVAYYLAPTSEQIAHWARDGVQ